MSKKFKNKVCVYCGRENASATEDHVFAREFFLLTKRHNLPQVPACRKCNNEKSTLEHYLLSVLPFGAQHTDAIVNLESMVPARLAKNAKLHRRLAVGMNREWIKDNGIVLPRLTLPLDSAKLDELFRFIVKGLLWHHWEVVLTAEYFVGAGTLSGQGERIFLDLFNKNANARVSVDLGDGTLQYDGVQGFNCPQLSIWKFKMYGGLKLSGAADVSLETPSLVWGLTCRNELSHSSAATTTYGGIPCNTKS
jgi:hypothetical protein